MLYNLWDTLLYKPLINILAFLVSVVPYADLGIAVILLTVLVKILLFPLSKASIQNQEKMGQMGPELSAIKKSGKSKEEQAKATFDLYKKYKTNPFSGCLLILIQIPIVFALYYVFWKGLSFDPSNMYSFIKPPEGLNTMFLGLIDLSGKSLVLAILAGASQYLQAMYMPKSAQVSDPGSFGDSFQKSMQMQMKYVFPFLVGIIAYSISGAVALYWVVNNLFTTGQQIYLRNKSKTVQLYEKRSN